MKQIFFIKFLGIIALMSIISGFTLKEKIQDNQKNNELMQALHSMMDRIHVLKKTGNFDVDFAAILAEHHEGAVDMMDIALKSVKDAKLKAIIDNRYEKEKEEIRELRELIKVVGETRKTLSDNSILLNTLHVSLKEMQSMEMTNDVETDFANMMILHHKSGLELARAELTFGNNKNMKDIAQKLIQEQEKETAELKEWLSTHKPSESKK